MNFKGILTKISNTCKADWRKFICIKDNTKVDIQLLTLS